MTKMRYYAKLLYLLLVQLLFAQPDGFEFDQSTLQANYSFGNITINGNALESNDWVAVFNGEICVGSVQWDTSQCNNGICTVPAMGYDGTETAKITQVKSKGKDCWSFSYGNHAITTLQTHGIIDLCSRARTVIGW